MQKTKSIFFVTRKIDPIGTYFFEQIEGGHDIGLNKFTGGVNRAVHMAFRSKIHHRTWPVFREQTSYQRPITDIPPHKDMPGFSLKTCQIIQVSGIGQLIKINY